MDELLNQFFAYAPWIGFLLIVAVVYFTTRGHLHRHVVPFGQTFACNQCGHRDKRDHMVPVVREGSVLWYCHRHAA
ncbi:MAG: hypothetical protein GIW97_09185 [Candidatus Eremiobacteraeota bacterium]|nr:hypothetical protein [Candidatus Eremiobacteraeota bacterium]